MHLARNIFSVILALGFVSMGEAVGSVPQGAALQTWGNIDSAGVKLGRLITGLQSEIESRQMTEQAGRLSDSIEIAIRYAGITDTLLLSDASYIAGVYNLMLNNTDRAAQLLSDCRRYREKVGVADLRYSRCLSNLAVVDFNTGDYDAAYRTGLEALTVRRAVTLGDTSSFAVNYANLASYCLEKNDLSDAIDHAETGLEISRLYPGMVRPEYVANMYQVIGLSLFRRSEYIKSLEYCREALRLYNSSPETDPQPKLLILNTLSQIHNSLDQPTQEENYLKEGLAFARERKLPESYLLYINYADLLTKHGKFSEGEKVLNDGLRIVRETFGSESREYCMMLASAAEYSYRYAHDARRALAIYRDCFVYLDKNPQDVAMKLYILGNYARRMYDSGEYATAIALADSVLSIRSGDTSVLNPARDLEILLLRYKSLNALSSVSQDPGLLKEAISTGDKIVTLFDLMRNEMTEEESRNNLSAVSREFYISAIDNYASLYESENDRSYMNGAFEFLERGKVAGFLASMRELNAARFSLPPELVSLDNYLRNQIGFYKELISNENGKARPDRKKITTWESATFGLVRSRDSLIKVFETNYPAYFGLKYRNGITDIEEVPDIIGRDANLISYMLTDRKLYLFLVNSRERRIITTDIDSVFFSSLSRFRSLLNTMPSGSEVRKPFNEYMDLGFYLYSRLLEPAVPYLKGDKIIISPDNILSYLPFETLITSEFRSPELLYREAPFALKKYRFSYIYSVTLSSEIPKKTRSLKNRLAAFAPTYAGMEISDTLLNSYPGLRGQIADIPYAIVEAEDAVNQCGGRSFTLEEATEGAFKHEAGAYDIIHLAMHTLVDDHSPAFSKMIFSPDSTGKEDGYLNTYEVYNTTLSAMMVVLSSCNTGTGLLVSGEGILSLARGFLSAGSRSVVMSMWEVEDFASSEVIKHFYRNLRRGMTKSEALRSSRLSYLGRANQAHSHPYYWATLVIYGDDTPLYFNKTKLYLAMILLFSAAAALTAVIYKGPRS